MCNTEHDKKGARIKSLDGLRGIAAAIVVLYHYLLLLHWEFLPRRGPESPLLSDLPVAILWNGRFSVTLFFVLSGFVIAAAADRRKANVLYNVLARYLRLAIPVTASVFLAWMWLSLLPDATIALRDDSASPSLWLRHTYQGETPTYQGAIPGPHFALVDGLVANFVRGFSRFNNVLWTMQYELIGSLGIFLVFGFFHLKVRLAIFVICGLAISLWLDNGYYFGFASGALMYEAQKFGMLDRLPHKAGLIALICGLLIGWPAIGLGDRWGISLSPKIFELGTPGSIWSVIAATLFVFAALKSIEFSWFLNAPALQFLGRISFGLYLLHVPILYTVVARLIVATTLPEAAIVGIFAVLVLLLAFLFTVVVDEPVLRALKRLSAVRKFRALSK